MALTVIRFSQEASLENPTDMKNFLVLRNGSGVEIRILVSTEDMSKVIKIAFITSDTPESVEMELAEPVITDNEEDIEETRAEVFGGNILLPNSDEDGIESL